MPEPTNPPAKHERSLLGFYIAMGVVAALFGLGVWLWTPLSALYWERQVRTPSGYGVWLESGHMTSGQQAAAGKLAEIGPRAGPAFRRLLESDDVGVRTCAMSALSGADTPWALPLLVKAAFDENDALAMMAILSIENCTSQRFLQPRIENVRRARERLKEWWEREGKAKYGEDEK